MRQRSLFSVDVWPPRVADLAGLLCGPGQAVLVGRGAAARLSVVVAERWRADGIAAVCAQRGLSVELAVTGEGHPLVRTAFSADLVDLAACWTRGAVKAVPADLQLDGWLLRTWALAAGRYDGRGYVLGLDPKAPGTVGPLAVALAAAGLAGIPLGPRSGGPVLRVTGGRRLARLAELVGEPPAGAPEGAWPAG